MAVEVVVKRTAQVLVENGYDAEGNVKYKNMSLGTLASDTSRWDADKALAITDALKPCISQTIGGTTTTVVANIDAD